jgi:uncharacterized protein YjiS (DUF1127 family)
MSMSAVMANPQKQPFWTAQILSLILIDGIKNIRFTNQFLRRNMEAPEESGGAFGWSGAWFWGDFAPNPQSRMETDMSAKFPVLPIPLAALARAIVAGSRWLKDIARARRHRREASVLCNLDSRVLKDIGITRSDLRDAFSAPFWEDPTALLHERALERRLNRALAYAYTPGPRETASRLPPVVRSPRLVA